MGSTKPVVIKGVLIDATDGRPKQREWEAFGESWQEHKRNAPFSRYKHRLSLNQNPSCYSVEIAKSDVLTDATHKIVGKSLNNKETGECAQGCKICEIEKLWQEAVNNNALILQQQEALIKNPSQYTDEQKVQLEAFLTTHKKIISGELFQFHDGKEKCSACGNRISSNFDYDHQLKSEFSIHRLFEFIEFQRSCPTARMATFYDDFDGFWLHVIKKRLLHLLRTKGPNAYNRVATRIREIVDKYKQPDQTGTNNEKSKFVISKFGQSPLAEVNSNKWEQNVPIITTTPMDQAGK